MFKGWSCGHVSSPPSLLALRPGLSTSPNTSLCLLRLTDGNAWVCRRLQKEESKGDPGAEPTSSSVFGHGASATFLSVPPGDCKLCPLSLSCPISLKELAPHLARWGRRDPSCHSSPHLSLIQTWPVPTKMSLPEGPVSWAETSQLPLCVAKYENYEERSMFTSHLLCAKHRAKYFIISMSLR